MSPDRCPLCGSEYAFNHGACNQWHEHSEWYYYCAHFGMFFYLHDSVAAMPQGELREQLFNLITEHLLHSQGCAVNGGESRWHFYFSGEYQGPENRTPEYVDLSILMKDYPVQVMDKAHRALVNLSLHYPHYGDQIFLSPHERRIVFEHRRNNVNITGMMRILEDLGYLKDLNCTGDYVITAAGWQKIDELRKNEQVVRQAFIAMIFREEARSIREAFRQAIGEMGYHAVILDEKEHNNQIVPEIFYEIRRSKFVVVDVTYPSFGAYYEAGYAQALGKEVIVCCREREFNDPVNSPHFDIAQQAIITWKDEAELVRKLKRRIEATVT